MDNEQPHQELVKCVVVGDTAVGKTRLICTRTCDRAPMTLAQLLTTHVPTVWAIDQYRMSKEVLERSIHCVDNVNVSLRLWDTFGDHEKDRRFAYGRSDVVLLCFSIASRVSLRNCRLRWFEEIRKFCPNTPVILVGCKNDLRFVIEDKSYLHIYKERSPFVRLIKKTELVLPDEARQLANDLGIYYYETSVLTGYGLNDVFENAIRIALIARRQQRFWITNLKRIDWPHLQQPFTPPKRNLPTIDIDESRYEFHLNKLFETEMFADLRIVYDNNEGELFGHRFILAAASKLFQRIFAASSGSVSNVSNTNLTRSSSESSLVSNLDEDFDCEDFFAVRKSFSKTVSSFKFWDQLKRHASHQILNVFETRPLRDFNGNGYCQRQNQKLLKSFLHVTNHFETMTSSTTSNYLTIQLNASVNWPVFKQCIRFIYTGEIDCENEYSRSEIIKTAELFEFDLLVDYLKNINDRKTLQRIQRQQFLKFCEQNQFTDIVFKLDDSICSAHKALLVARCDLMNAMFRGNFRESQAKIVLFPGVSKSTFRILINYLYLDEIPKLSTNGCLAIIELANRFCLPRLLNQIEFRLVEELERQALVHDDDHHLLDVLQKCFQLLEPVKFHNAFQLSDWCLNFLCLNYNNVCKNLAKYLRQMSDENRKYLVENRYPPIWYLKDCDFYERQMAEQRALLKEKRRPTADKSKYGCLCFAKAKVLSKNVLATPTTTVTPMANNVPLRCL